MAKALAVAVVSASASGQSFAVGGTVALALTCGNYAETKAFAWALASAYASSGCGGIANALASKRLSLIIVQVKWSMYVYLRKTWFDIHFKTNERQLGPRPEFCINLTESI